MKKKILIINLIILLLFLFNSTNVYSKHIVGGEATYKLKSTDGFLGGFAVYEFKFTIYRDAISGGADFDQIAVFGVYKQTSNGWRYYTKLTESVDNIESIPNIDNPCYESPPNIRYEKGEYIFELKLQIIESTYQITYQRCCRTNDIINIYSPELTGATYYVEISSKAQILGNSSPVFKNFPPTVLCSNSYFEFNHSATDIDGDSLTYEFFTPLHGGGLAGFDPATGGNASDCNGVQPVPSENCLPPFPDVSFKSPYRFDNPIGGSPFVDVNKITGYIHGKPVDLGHFVVGIRIKEYRDGVLIGTVQRDFQFVVTPCSPTVNAVVGDGNQIDVRKFEIKSCGSDTVTFINESYNKNKIFDVYWEFDVNGDNFSTSDWDATVIFPSTGQYAGKLVLNRGYDCNDSIDLEINIFPGVYADFDYEHDSCSADPVLFNDFSYSEGGSIKKWKWDLGDGHISSQINPSNKYFRPGDYNVSLIVEDDNECMDTAISKIEYYPISEDIKVKPSHYLGCAPVSVTFNNNTEIFDGRYKIKWDFGDGSVDTVFSPVHLYDNPGNYSVNVEITSPIGCSIEKNYNEWLEIRPSPVADFDYSPLKPNIVVPIVDFKNNSIDGISYLWEFGDGDISNDFEPQHTYRDTGLYEVSHIVIADNYCTDTLIKDIYIYPDIQIFFPNAFTPNGDGKNDEFYGIGANPSFMHDFVLTIWDRWGGLVFKTEDSLESWRGSKFNSGAILPQGVYVYKYFYKSSRGRIFKGKGFVTLIK